MIRPESGEPDEMIARNAPERMGREDSAAARLEVGATQPMLRRKRSFNKPSVPATCWDQLLGIPVNNLIALRQRRRLA